MVSNGFLYRVPNQLSQAKLADTERALQTEQNTRIEEQQRYEQHGMALGGDSDAENVWEMNKQKWEYNGIYTCCA